MVEYEAEAALLIARSPEPATAREERRGVMSLLPNGFDTVPPDH
jgi:hypothetical protein